MFVKEVKRVLAGHSGSKAADLNEALYMQCAIEFLSQRYNCLFLKEGVIFYEDPYVFSVKHKRNTDALTRSL